MLKIVRLVALGGVLFGFGLQASEPLSSAQLKEGAEHIAQLYQQYLGKPVEGVVGKAFVKINKADYCKAVLQNYSTSDLFDMCYEQEVFESKKTMHAVQAARQWIREIEDGFCDECMRRCDQGIQSIIKKYQRDNKLQIVLHSQSNALARLCINRNIHAVRDVLSLKESKQLVDVRSAGCRRMLQRVCLGDDFDVLNLFAEHGANMSSDGSCDGLSIMDIAWCFGAHDDYEKSSQRHNFLSVFDALRADIEFEKLSSCGQELHKAYVEFQRGRPAQLQNLIAGYNATLMPVDLVPMDGFCKLIEDRLVVIQVLREVFQSTSISLLLKWLTKVAPDKNTKKNIKAISALLLLHAQRQEEIEEAEARARRQSQA